MMRRLTAFAAALAFALTSFTPVAADARDRRHDGYYDRHYDGHHYRRRHRDRDDGDAVAAGVIGLVLGLAIGAAASQPRERDRCYDNYRRCAPPPPRRDYYDEGYYEGGYEDSRAAYEREYGMRPDDDRYEQCTRTERQWDRYANRYVTVDVPC